MQCDNDTNDEEATQAADGLPSSAKRKVEPTQEPDGGSSPKKLP